MNEFNKGYLVGVDYFVCGFIFAVIVLLVFGCVSVQKPVGTSVVQSQSRVRLDNGNIEFKAQILYKTTNFYKNSFIEYSKTYTKQGKVFCETVVTVYVDSMEVEHKGHELYSFDANCNNENLEFVNVIKENDDDDDDSFYLTPLPYINVLQNIIREFYNSTVRKDLIKSWDSGRVYCFDC